jgi:hypothetical protein
MDPQDREQMWCRRLKREVWSLLLAVEVHREAEAQLVFESLGQHVTEETERAYIRASRHLNACMSRTDQVLAEAP